MYDGVGRSQRLYYFIGSRVAVFDEQMFIIRPSAALLKTGRHPGIRDRILCLEKEPLAGACLPPKIRFSFAAKLRVGKGVESVY